MGSNCKNCSDTGLVTLFTSTEPCDQCHLYDLACHKLLFREFKEELDKGIMCGVMGQPCCVIDSGTGELFFDRNKPNKSNQYWFALENKCHPDKKAPITARTKFFTDVEAVHSFVKQLYNERKFVYGYILDVRKDKVKFRFGMYVPEKNY